MLQKTYTEVSFKSDVDHLNVQYKKDFLTPQKADKYYEILDNYIKGMDNSDSKRINVSFGDKESCKVYPEAQSWDENNDIICQIIRVMKHQVEKFTGLKYNYAYINRYPTGAIGMNKHQDREVLDEESAIVGISLGCIRDLSFEPVGFIPEEMPKKITLSLDHGSIYVMHYPTNAYWSHEIPKMPKLYKSRVSITFRYVYPDENNKQIGY